MRSFFSGVVRKAVSKSGLSRQEIAYSVLPSFLLDIIQRYLRVRCVGAEHIPLKGPCIIIANHSGYMGFDAVMLGHQVMRKRKRVPRIVAHKLWFIRPEIAIRAHKFGLIEATYANSLKILKKGHPLILFPEGEEGNFKPTRLRYRLRRFRRGFIRLALATGAPIIPAVVVGAEETHITVSQIRWAKEVLGIILPVPLNVLPLPAKWTIRFFKPIRIKKNLAKVDDIEYVTRLSQEVRRSMQLQLNSQLKKRHTVYL